MMKSLSNFKKMSQPEQQFFRRPPLLSAKSRDWDEDEIAIASGSDSSSTGEYSLPSDSDAEEDKPVCVDCDDHESESLVSADDRSDQENWCHNANDENLGIRNALLWQAIISNSYICGANSSREEVAVPEPWADAERSDNAETTDSQNANVPTARSSTIRKRRRPRRHPSRLHYRHEVPRSRPRPLNEGEQENAVVHPLQHHQQQPQPEVDQEVFLEAIQTDDFTMLSASIYHFTVPTALCAVPLTILFILLDVLLPMQLPETAVVLLCAAFMVFIGAQCLYNFVVRPDFQIGGGSTQATLEKQIIQLLTIVFVFPYLMWTQILQIFNPLDMYDPLRWYHWIPLTFKYFMFSFTCLFTLDIPLSFRRMIQTNPVFGEVLAFELVAHVLPVVYITAPLLAMNFLASSIIPPHWQSLWLWAFIHLLAFSWIALILVGVATYPENTVQRNHGVTGYVFMGTVTMVQGLLVAVFLIFLRLANYMIVPVIRQLLSVEYTVILSSRFYGPFRYFKQIHENVPHEEWTFHYPYPITFGLLTMVCCVITQLRILNLSLFLLGYDERMENVHFE